MDYWIFLFSASILYISSTSGSLTGGKFATSPYYNGFRLVLANQSYVISSYYFPTSSPVLETRMFCATRCLSYANCHAFNFYSNRSYHTCELLADNICLSKSERLALVIQPDGLVFDKLKPQMAQSCIDQKFVQIPATLWCENARPGCTGTWPNCNSCVETCIDCHNRFGLTKEYSCTLWPGGTQTMPIFATCYDQLTYIMRRSVQYPTGAVTRTYMMPFADINRIIRLRVYNLLQFYYELTFPYQQYFGYYSNPYIDVDGQLSNITYFEDSFCTNCSDGLGVGSTPLAPVPFVWVPYNPADECGSFWLLKPDNSLDCPGGPNMGLFGNPQISQWGITCTGMHWPEASSVDLNQGDIGLTN